MRKILPLIRQDDNYRLLLSVLVEKLGGMVTVKESEIAAMFVSRKTLYVEISADEGSVTLEVVPDARAR